MAHGDLVYTMDATGQSNLSEAVATWRDVVARYATRDIRIARPVSLVIEDIPIMGATESTADGHRLHIASHAVGSGMLDGLMAHEMGHMIQTERGHPSHRIEVHRRAFDAVAVSAGQRRAFGAVAREAVNHVQDIYADDLAIDVIGRDRDIAGFFSNWVRNSARPSRSRWATVGQAVTVAFALGNLARHDIEPEPEAVRLAEEFARAERLPSLRAWTDGFRDLPRTDETPPIESAMRELLAGIAREASR